MNPNSICSNEPQPIEYHENKCGERCKAPLVNTGVCTLNVRCILEIRIEVSLISVIVKDLGVLIISHWYRVIEMTLVMMAASLDNYFIWLVRQN